MLKKLNKSIAVLAAVLILWNFNIIANAVELPDISRKGSVGITMKLDGKAVSGAGITLYHVGKINEENGDYNFIWTDEFKNCGLSLKDIKSEKLADDLENYIQESNPEGIEKMVDSNGIIRFDDLELGLYFAVQSETPSGYIQANSFLISVPLFENGKYIYSVDASPKLELKTDNIPELTTAVVPEIPSKPSQPALPQTGTLNWPVPILIVSGLAFFIMGWSIKYGRRTNEDEK